MAEADQVGLFFAQPLSGNVTLVIEFSYSLVRKDTGFYLDPYVALDGTEYLYAATKMEVCQFTVCMPRLRAKVCRQSTHAYYL